MARNCRSDNMTRIETISFSAMEKLRRFSLRSWKVGITGFLAVVLMLWAMVIACHRTVQLIPGSTIKDDHKLVNLEMDNARFEVSSQPTLQPGVDYWLTPALNHGALCLMVSVGHRTELFDVMSKAPSATSEELAAQAGLNERYVR